MSIEPVVQSPALPDPVTELRAMLLQVSDWLPAVAGDMESLAQGRESLVQLRNDLQTLVRTVEQMMIDAADGRKLTETSVGVVEVKSSLKRSQWRTTELLRHLYREAWGGDMGISPSDLIDLLVQVNEDCLPLTGSLGWRVTGLKEHGIDDSEWCLR